MSQYLIAHIGHTGRESEHVVWWKSDSRGYTFCIDKAGLYDEAEARSICSVGSCVAVSMFVAAQDARSTPYYRRQDGTLNKLYDGEQHRVVPNDAQVWKRLMTCRLDRCAQPDKPTPISAKKARAIYIDGLSPSLEAV